MEYHKIQTVWHRDPDNRFKTLLEGQWARPEFGYLQNCEWLFTEKVDGTNTRISWDGEKVTFRGRSEDSQIPTRLLAMLEESVTPDLMAKQFDGPAKLYGEGYGPKINKAGELYRDDISFVLFDVKIEDIWLTRKSVADIAAGVQIDQVPLIGKGTLHDMVKLVQDGFDSRWGSFAAEGIVARPAVELADRLGKRLITKLKAKDFPGAA